MTSVEVNRLQEVISVKFTEEVLKNVLAKRVGGASSQISIKDVILGPESKKGDSYLSNVVRFVIEYVYTKGDEEVKESLNLIAKCLPQNLGRRKTFRSLDFFENEAIFYNEVWPALDAFQKSKNVKNLFTDIPNCLIAFVDGENDYIVLENLCIQGYGGVDRAFLLDLEHAKLIASVFARFHGIALAFKDQKPTEFQAIGNALKETYFAEKFRPWYEKFQNILKSILIDAVKKELPDKYLVKLNEILNNNFYGTLSKICETRSPLAVITHGDAWMPNFLFKYNDKKNPAAIAMIDFQLTRFASPALDLLFFLYACADQKLRDDHFDEILSYYHSVFASTLTELGSDPKLISLDSIKQEMKEFGVFGVGMTLEALVMSLLEDDEVSDLDMIQGDQQLPIESVWIVGPLKTAEKRNRLAEFFKDLVDREIV